MKKKFIYICSLVGLMLFSSCSDELNTEPTDQVSGSQVFADATSAEAAINGIYRMMYVAGWSSDWGTENCGLTAINLLADLMAEDHLMYSQGQGWFYEDYRLNVHGDFANKSGRSYALWNFFYTMISNANYIIAAEETMGGDPDASKNIIGQAYAVRGFCYFNLIQIYQQTYINNQNAPGVPLYTEPTIAGSEGKGRGTVQNVYDQITADLNKAATLLHGLSQNHISHMDYYTVKGIQARVALVMHDYETAVNAAAEALTKNGLKLATVEELGGNNDVTVGDIMWGVEITADQSSQFASFFSHMDADAPGMYASKAPQCISSGLYKLIPSTDSRLNWFRGALAEEGSGSNVSYCQLKFKMADYTTRTGDYIFMRAEEMVLIKAEAECHLGQYSQARETIKQLGTVRDTDFETRLTKRTDSNSYNQDTNAPLITLMDEILFQRRVELWGEAGRIFDLQRLGLGYNRAYEGSNHTQTVQTKPTTAGSILFIMPLPQSEIDGNENISEADQNPIYQ